ncbi:sodium-dependent transporter [Blastomonas fulva]|jgi:NSS family neurotransmitter:Na+ symporter|uniref:sodium-dependent transporter n=1 Tax=Blastomonas fulva TaxID=1550728 RepID=UPI003D268655
MSASGAPDGRRWSSRLLFLIATIGFAVGLGNLWRFPYLAGENGGGAFILLYIAAVFMVGLPLVIAELAVGRSGGADPALAWTRLAQAEGASRRWAVIGHLGVAASFLIVSFYGVIGGWTLAFVWNALSGLVSGSEALDFKALLENPLALVGWQTLFIAINLAIIRLGLNKGVERAMAVLLPLLVMTLIAMLVVAAAQPEFDRAVEFLFAFDPAFLGWDTALKAVGQAFFSVGVGGAVLVTFGGYMDPAERIGRLAAVIVIADTLVAILAGLMIFPFVFSAGLDPTEGPTLLFVTMQAAFLALPGGEWFSAAFFFLVAMAALTSSVALFEMLAAIGEARGISRGRMLGGAGITLWVLGLGTVLSFNIAADWRPLGGIPLFAKANFFGVLDTLTSTIGLPLGGLLASVFAGWYVSREAWASRLGWPQEGWKLTIWLVLIRFFVPVVLAVALVTGLLR